MMGKTLPVMLKLPAGITMEKTNREEITLFPSVQCRLRDNEAIDVAVVSVDSDHRSA